MPERLLSAAACAEIAARAEKATAGPWGNYGTGPEFQLTKGLYEAPPGGVTLGTVENTEPMVRVLGYGYGEHRVLANAEFIAAAREDIPALLRTVAALREALEPFAAMAREGDKHEPQAGELVVQRGVASDMTVIHNRDWALAAQVYEATQ